MVIKKGTSVIIVESSVVGVICDYSGFVLHWEQFCWDRSLCLWADGCLVDTEVEKGRNSTIHMCASNIFISSIT